MRVSGHHVAELWYAPWPIVFIIVLEYRKMSHWNYRVMQQPERPDDPDDKGIWLAIHEVFYDDDGEVDGWTKDAVTVGGNSKEELLKVLENMTAAAEKPVLDYEV